MDTHEVKPTPPRRPTPGGELVQPGRAQEGRFWARYIASRLNGVASSTYLTGTLPSGTPRGRSRMARVTFSAWKAIEAVLTPSLSVLGEGQLTAESERRFHRLAERWPPLLAVRGSEAEFIPRDPRGEAVWRLWLVVRGRALNRLRRCPQCAKWFVDETKNLKQARCSAACTWAWWSRTRRRAARHGTARRVRRARRATK